MRICYFGTYNPEEGRNKIYMTGLRRLGVTIVECRTDKKGLAKYFDLIKKHSKIKNDYDALVVGYPGHALVPLAGLISRKKVIFDALCTMYEGVIISRKQFSEWSLNSMYIKMIDWLAVKFSDFVLVETEHQKDFFEKRFGKSRKYIVVYTGSDDSIFHTDDGIRKRDEFTAVFRGKFLPEAGVAHIIDSAKILEKSGIRFIVLGSGYLEKEIRAHIASSGASNIELVSRFLSYDEMREIMLSAHVSLGQFEDHPRLSRTIPHKCFETLALGLPYVTARTIGVLEILSDGESAIFVSPADPADLAEKISKLKNDPELAKRIGEAGYRIYKQKFTPEALAKQIIALV